MPMLLPTVMQNKIARSPVFLGTASASIGIVGGGLAIYEPKLFFAGAITLMVGGCFFAFSQQTIIFLLILRSGLDAFSAQSLPAAFALGLDALVITYVLVAILTHQKIQVDRAWCLFAGWIAIQSLWPVLTAIGGLPLGSAFLTESIREWVRVFSWLMVYLIINQLKDKLHPEQVINRLFWALAIPLTAAALQLAVPLHLLPSFLQPISATVFKVGSRINGTLGHPNTFASFLVLFVALTYWKLGRSHQKVLWILLLGAEIFFLVNTKALVGLSMLGVLLLVLTLPQLSVRRLVGAILIIAVLLAFFASTEFGRERLASVLETPILNPDISINRAVLLSWFDGNSFNWRLAQWTFLIEEWKRSPIFGYGLGLATYLGPIQAYAHNDYIRALVEGGIVGFCAFLLLQLGQLIYLVRLWFGSQNLAQKNFCLGLIAVLIAALVGMATENIWSHTTFFFYWWTLFAIAGWDWNQSAVEQSPSLKKL